MQGYAWQPEKSLLHANADSGRDVFSPAVPLTLYLDVVPTLKCKERSTVDKAYHEGVCDSMSSPAQDEQGIFHKKLYIADSIIVHLWAVSEQGVEGVPLSSQRLDTIPMPVNSSQNPYSINAVNGLIGAFNLTANFTDSLNQFADMCSPWQWDGLRGT